MNKPRILLSMFSRIHPRIALLIFTLIVASYPGTYQNSYADSFSDFEKEMYAACMSIKVPKMEANGKENPKMVAHLVCKIDIGNCLSDIDSESCQAAIKQYRVKTRIPAPPKVYIAAQSDDVDLVKKLIDEGADINKPRDERKSALPGEPGWTPLMIATAEGHKDVVAVLLKAGANYDIKGRNGETALSIAKDYEYQVIINMLIAHGAK
ncbi:MAG: hypothetical protein BMS9Abin36_1277 [Gammaproteobacteria bacterium]|nr:MAG: hypothetical protein BMS9Abin36_1277 [Gammaproteobacteria bacterium]